MAALSGSLRRGSSLWADYMTAESFTIRLESDNNGSATSIVKAVYHMHDKVAADS
jgi:hypothetical protein